MHSADVLLVVDISADISVDVSAAMVVFSWSLVCVSTTVVVNGDGGVVVWAVVVVVAATMVDVSRSVVGVFTMVVVGGDGVVV